ncbi:BPL-N domain-containing protein [Candidatus Aciduliprofundum boonei]|uniref:Biotin-protein ligase-like protein n=1 Tax=Aciduliprofundum boonei (strain DSM 19572 / T469) TaxID=439481 RepID=B5ICR3_ACIB4|nr:BPL-N domain-containing protein [Candidatus Aciduliprofundum boonei]ADD09145.1 Biotin-protein ligase-like protein [Aciduliprofundum boonei T469]EDY35940.1 hypothetical protein ABOONEI_2901 [Aciduliprofundum boonei T469]
MRDVKIFAVVVIIVVIIVAFYYLIMSSNPISEPPNFRVTIIRDKMFVRWSSNESTIGEIEINGINYTENSSHMLHKLVVPHISKGHMRILEYKDGKDFATYCVELSKIHNVSLSAGIYAGYGADTGSYRMLSSLLVNMGFDTQFLIAENFNKLYDLFKFDIIAFPGGRADHMIMGLSRQQIDTLREYVSQGGSYMGICAGAYFASNYTVWNGIKYGDNAGYILDLYSGDAVGPIKEIGNYDLNSTYNPQYPTNITWYNGEIFNVTYWGGPYFTPTNNVKVLAIYDKIHKPAAIKFMYHSGRVILFGFHPEINTYYSQENREMFLKALKIEILWLAGL